MQTHEIWSGRDRLCKSVTFGALVVFALAILPIVAQTTPSTPPEQPSRGKIIFSRSTDENGQTTPQPAHPAVWPAAGVLPRPQVELPPPQIELAAPQVVFTAFDLDVRLRVAAQQIAVRAQLTVRNDGKTPLDRIPLQISSSLNWESLRVNGQNAAFTVATLNSDADHTGQLHEATVALSQPLAPGASLQLDGTYSGAVPASAQRLLAMNAPSSVALHSDWDQISVPFTGLRGFGNVVWYPVVSVPVLLGDGARLFDAIGEHKLRLMGTRFRLRLTVEFPHGQAPTVALVNGQSLPLTITESGSLDQSQEVASVATADSGNTTLGFLAPSLFVAVRTAHPGANLTVWTTPENDVAVVYWTTAATVVTPFLQGWLGQKPRSPLTLLDLPDPDDSPFETGSLLAAPLHEPGPRSGPDPLTGTLVHALTHAWLTAPNAPEPLPAWLNEGVAGFMGTLWVEKQHGRDQALRTLEADRAALALAEPTPGESLDQPLAKAISPICYRTKAAYIFWMLRDLSGDAAISAALRAYNPAAGVSYEKLLEEAGTRSEIGWFFADWVDADKGLPDLSIAGVFPTSASAGNWLVAVNIVNAGYASAEVPVTVRSASNFVTKRVRIPAHGKTTERILVQGKPTEVQVNDGTVPETQADIHITKLEEAGDAAHSSSQ